MTAEPLTDLQDIDSRSLRLDLEDPLGTYRDRFVGTEPDGEVVAYLDGNSLGRPLRVTRERLGRFIDEAWGGRLIRGWDEAWMEEPTSVGDRIGTVLLGAAPGQVFVADSTSVLLYKLIRAGVDAAQADDAMRREIVIDRDNFPTDRFIIEGIAAERGLEVRWVDTDPDGGVTPEDLAPAVGPKTALVVLSQIAYRSGHLADVSAITELVHDAGARILWDLCHSVASVPIALDADGVDLAVGCTYKYLNGGPGSPAFAYVRADLQQSLAQPIWGWMGAAQPFEMTESYAPHDGVRQFITGTPPILAIQPMTYMLDLLEEVGIDAVRAKSIALTGHAITLIDERLVPLGARLSSPRDASQRGSHVTVDHPKFRTALDQLWARGVVPDFRPPEGLRIGLSPLSTSFAELDHGIAAIRDALHG